MSYRRYDEREIIRKLDQLDPAAKVSFAAACAQRQIPGYLSFSQQTGQSEPDTLITILECARWDALGRKKMGDDEVRVNLDRCMELIPKEDEGPWVNEQAYEEDAASAVAYVLRARNTDESQEAAYAARVAYEALDHHVINRLGVDDEERVFLHPVVQAELARQQRDLDELQGCDGRLAEVIARLRHRAKTEATIFFGPVS